MTFTITHREGGMERDPSIECLPALIDELEHNDPEHPDVAVSHASGWTLSAFARGLVVWENVEQGDGPRHLRDVPRDRLLELFRNVADGQLETVEREAWIEGYS